MPLLRLIATTWIGRGAAGAAILLLVGVTVVAPRLSAAAPEAAFRTAPVSRGDVTQTVTVSGSVGAEQLKLAFRPQGRLQAVNVKVGDAVSAGQVLASLDPTDLRAAVKKAEADLLSAQAKYDQTAQGATAEDLALAKNALETATQNSAQALKDLSASIETAKQTLDRLQTAYGDAKSSFGSLSTEVVADAKRYRAAIASLASAALGVRGALQDVLRAGDVTTAYNAMLSAETSLGLAQTYASSLLDPATLDYSNAAGMVQAATNVLDGSLGSGGEATTAASVYAGAQQGLTSATTRLTSAIDAVAAQISAAQSSVNTAQTALNTQGARSDSTLDPRRWEVSQLLLDFTSESTLGSAIRSRTGQVTSSLGPITDAMGGSIGNAQTALATARDKERTTSQAQRISLENAKIDYAKTTAGSKASDIALADAGVKLAEVALEKARADLAGATLTAPAAGAVASVANAAGETPANPFIVLAVTGSLTLHGTVGEADIAKLDVGQAASLVVDAVSPRARLTGKVAALDPVASIQQGVPVYGVDVAIDRPDPAIRSGMTATATVTVASKRNVLTVPNSAIRRVGGQRVVQIVQDGAPTPVRATFGISDDSVTEVVDGLKEGQLVVLPATRSGATTGGQGPGPQFGGRQRAGPNSPGVIRNP